MLDFRSFGIAAMLGFLCLFAGCDTGHEADPVIGHAWAGPATLKLHAEIDTKSPAVAIVHHGDRLDIVGQKRRWYRVRTSRGAIGWTSDRQLLDQGQMERLRALAEETRDLPSQGIATTFATLNVHTEPSRLAPSFMQMKEKETVQVIAHEVAERNIPLPKRELIPPKPVEKKGAAMTKEKASKNPPPPAPAPPAPPGDWLELSKVGDPVPPADPAPPPEAHGPTDDWTLIRNETGQSGWVLTSGLYLAIPDEVAQYAEGHRITGYFSLGKIQDGDQQKDIWLWTISEKLGEDHDFDGYRVFVWSLRRHRYETAYIQRRERGFFPVIAKAAEFSVCLENDDGSRVRKQYVMTGNAVHLTGETPCMKTAAQAVAPEELVKEEAARDREPKNPAKKSFVEQIRDKAKGLFGQ